MFLQTLLSGVFCAANKVEKVLGSVTSLYLRVVARRAEEGQLDNGKEGEEAGEAAEEEGVLDAHIRLPCRWQNTNHKTQRTQPGH